MAEVEVNPINIGNINDGAVIEAFDIELRKVLANIAAAKKAAAKPAKKAAKKGGRK